MIVSSNEIAQLCFVNMMVKKKLFLILHSVHADCLYIYNLNQSVVCSCNILLFFFFVIHKLSRLFYPGQTPTSSEYGILSFASC